MENDAKIHYGMLLWQMWFKRNEIKNKNCPVIQCMALEAREWAAVSRVVTQSLELFRDQIKLKRAQNIPDDRLPPAEFSF